MGNRHKRKALESLRRASQEHREKIEAEKTRPIPDENLIRFWKKEIKNFEARVIQIERQLTKHQTRRRKMGAK